jgi:hypothetical protein
MWPKKQKQFTRRMRMKSFGTTFSTECRSKPRTVNLNFLLTTTAGIYDKKRKRKQLLPGLEQKLPMALVNVNIFIGVLGDEELSYLWRIFGSAFAIAVENEKPCPEDGVAAVAVHDMDTVGLVICPSETAELNMNHIRQEQRFQSRIPYGDVDLPYSEDERVFSIVLRFETLQARKEAVMNLSSRRTRGTQQDSTAVKLFEGMSFINPNDESWRYKIVSLNRNDVMCINKMTKVE